MGATDEYCTCPEEPGFTTMGCPVHDVARPESSPTDDVLEQASARVDEEIAEIRWRLVSTTPSGMCMQTAHELAARLRGVERAVRTLKTVAIQGSERLARARILLRTVDEILEIPGSNQVATRKQPP